MLLLLLGAAAGRSRSRSRTAPVQSVVARKTQGAATLPQTCARLRALGPMVPAQVHDLWLAVSACVRLTSELLELLRVALLHIHDVLQAGQHL